MSHPHEPRILIVEDDPLFAALVATRLRIEGMQSIECPGGREALEVVGRRPLDLVILDIMMPEVDGYQVLQHIRATAETARLPVILLSASTEPADVEKGIALGANYYVTKPFNAADLVRKVRLCLEERKARPETSSRVGSGLERAASGGSVEGHAAAGEAGAANVNAPKR